MEGCTRGGLDTSTGVLVSRVRKMLIKVNVSKAQGVATITIGVRLALLLSSEFLEREQQLYFTDNRSSKFGGCDTLSLTLSLYYCTASSLGFPSFHVYDLQCSSYLPKSHLKSPPLSISLSFFQSTFSILHLNYLFPKDHFHAPN